MPSYTGVQGYPVVEFAGGGGMPTTYTQAIVPTSGTIPATAVLTYTLNAAATSNVTITPSPTNGSFSPSTVTITTGNTTGTTTFTDSTIGVSTISSTNSAGLTDPANITFNATGATTYTQSISPTSGPTPATGTLTYTLGGILGVSITITPSATHGTFTPSTVVIAAGQTTGSTVLSDSTVGASTISSTNNQSLTNPSNITFTVTAGATSYTQSASPTSFYVPGATIITYTLNAVGGSDVIITPAANTYGTFYPATVDIPAGQTTGTSVFASSYVGTTTLSATNGQGLTNPGTITVAGSITPTPTAQGGQPYVNINRPLTNIY